MVLGALIDEYQTGFVEGRNILDGVVITQEIIYHCYRRKSWGIILKLDFHNAYDSVDWTCLLETFAYGGFSARWINWILL